MPQFSSGKIKTIEFIGEITSDYEETILIGEDDICEYARYYLQGKIVVINYLISEEELTKQEFLERRLESVLGKLDSISKPVYGSEYTGFMWNHSRFKVGDHNILDNLRREEGKYCFMKLTLHNREDIIDELLED